MATINTTRAAAMPFNGMVATNLRPVVEGPAFDPNLHQIVADVGGRELYFYEWEVVRSEDEEKALEGAASKAEEARNKRKQEGEERAKSKEENIGKAMGKPDDGKPIPAQQVQGVPGAALIDDRHRFNRLPGDPPIGPIPTANPPATSPVIPEDAYTVPQQDRDRSARVEAATAPPPDVSQMPRNQEAQQTTQQPDARAQGSSPQQFQQDQQAREAGERARADAERQARDQQREADVRRAQDQAEIDRRGRAGEGDQSR